VVRVFCHGKLVAEIIPELWLLNRGNVHVRGAVTEERIRDLAVITAKPDFSSPK